MWSILTTPASQGMANDVILKDEVDYGLWLIIVCSLSDLYFLSHLTALLYTVRLSVAEAVTVIEIIVDMLDVLSLQLGFDLFCSDTSCIISHNISICWSWRSPVEREM